MKADTVDRRLKDALGEVVAAAGPSAERESFRGIERRAGHLQWRRRTVAGAMAVVLGGSTVALAAREHDSDPVMDSGPTPTTVEVPAGLDPTLRDEAVMEVEGSVLAPDGRVEVEEGSGRPTLVASGDIEGASWVVVVGQMPTGERCVEIVVQAESSGCAALDSRNTGLRLAMGFPVGESVALAGWAPPGTSRVTLTADGVAVESSARDESTGEAPSAFGFVVPIDAGSVTVSALAGDGSVLDVVTEHVAPPRPAAAA
ncbi:MAG: hypothetical protein ACR2H3_10210 [Acidimicrobiales bacterium]